MKRTLKLIAFLVACGLIGAAVGYFGVKNIDGIFEHYTKSDAWTLLIALPLVYLIVIGSHELGHVVSGVVNRFNFYSMALGPFSWRKEGDALRFFWNKNFNLSGGVAVMFPVGEEQLRRRYLLFVVGGPLASLIIGVFCLLLALLPPMGSSVGLVLGVTGFCSLGIFVLTLVPFESQGITSDGRRIQLLTGDSERAEVELTMLRAVAFLQTTRPLSELPIDSISQAIENPKAPEPSRAMLHYFSYLYWLDLRDVDKAEIALEAFLSAIGEFAQSYQDSCNLEVVFFYVFEKPDPKKARRAMDAFKPSMFTTKFECEFAQAAVASLAELPGESALQKLRSELEKYSISSVEKSKIALFERWIGQLEVKIGQ
jgi:hypothetical protein